MTCSSAEELRLRSAVAHAATNASSPGLLGALIPSMSRLIASYPALRASSAADSAAAAMVDSGDTRNAAATGFDTADRPT